MAGGSGRLGSPVRLIRRSRSAARAETEPDGAQSRTQRLEIPLGITVNGRVLTGSQAPDGTLLAFLRERGLTAAKEACGQGECGACTVLIDGEPRLACITLSVTVSAPVVTAECTNDTISAVQQAFADHAAFQCGYCTPGHVVAASAMVAEGPIRDREQLRHRISGNLCRCTGYSQILDAIEDAAKR